MIRLSLRTFSRLVTVGLGLLGLIGCGQNDLKTYPVKGKVIYKDQPVEGAAVIFAPTAGPLATGITNAQGEFQLMTFSPGDGAVADGHVVAVRKSEGAGLKIQAPTVTDGKDLKALGESGKRAAEEMQAKMKQGGTKKLMSEMTPSAKDLLPTIYSKKETSPLKATVTDDPKANDFTFTLQD